MDCSQFTFIKTINILEAIKTYVQDSNQAEMQDFVDNYMNENNISMEFSINDRLDVVVELTDKVEDELLSIINSSFPEEEIPIIMKVFEL